MTPPDSVTTSSPVTPVASYTRYSGWRLLYSKVQVQFHMVLRQWMLWKPSGQTQIPSQIQARWKTEDHRPWYSGRRTFFSRTSCHQQANSCESKGTCEICINSHKINCVCDFLQIWSYNQLPTVVSLIKSYYFIWSAFKSATKPPTFTWWNKTDWWGSSPIPKTWNSLTTMFMNKCGTEPSWTQRPESKQGVNH